MKTFINLNEQKNTHLIFNKPGSYVVFFYNLSGKYSFNIQSTLVRLDIFGLYIGKAYDQFSIQTIQNHEVSSSTSNLLIKGVFYDSSKFNYKGLVRIEKNAQKSYAYQKNQNLLMSDNAFVESKPYLEILANDVFCTHGSTTGKLNQEQLYFLQSRGVSKIQGENLMIRGFIHDIIDKIKILNPNFSNKYI